MEVIKYKVFVRSFYSDRNHGSDFFKIFFERDTRNNVHNCFPKSTEATTLLFQKITYENVQLFQFPGS